ncbi:hypothetical protein [Aliihoeflea sp. 40Bstr573]|uniref:hypothetical protein n=1 Tax=Aliihoeflea sp. 40Bstr573 TaxID=2696467 RepID=UPI0020949843|nr:hypothetical protein [Aliihoeflea sp. 40Bstr573]
MQQTPPPRRQAKSPMDALKAVYDQSRGANQAAQKLEPLLSLLEQPEGETSPIEQLQEILETIVLGQRQLHLSLEDLHAKMDAMAASRRPALTRP